MALSITGILAIVVLVLALVVVLLGMAFRVKKLKSELKVREDDNITPYMRTASHYYKGDFSLDTKINALNKISKQFFRDLFKFSSEKTFEEIAELANDGDIKKFCSDMGVIRYSKNLGQDDINELYKAFQDILLKRRPKWASQTPESIAKKPMTVDELMNRKMKKDISDIKKELDKMNAPELPSQPLPPTQQPLPIKAPEPPRIPPAPQQSTDEKLAQIIQDIESQPSQTTPPKPSTPPAQITAQIAIKSSSRPAAANPNKVISQLVKNAPLIKPNKIVQISQVKISKARNSAIKPNKRLLTSIKINPDDETINQEIVSLNARLQRLLDSETEKRLGEVGR